MLDHFLEYVLTNNKQNKYMYMYIPGWGGVVTAGNCIQLGKFFIYFPFFQKFLVFGLKNGNQWNYSLFAFT